MTRLLVTGATGFLGAEIARQAVGAGHEVVLLRRSTSSLARIDSIPAEHAVGDLIDRASLDRAMRRVEVCIHVAGDTSYYLRDRERSRAVNVEGVKNIVDAARAAGVRRIVHTSSVAAIGFNRGGAVVDETAEWNWPSGLPYMETKSAGERIALGAACPELEVLALNPATIFGPGGLNVSEEQLVQDVRRRKLPAIPPGGMTICDVSDVAAAHLAALTRGRSGERYILGGHHVTHAALVRELAKAFDVPVPRWTVPRWALATAGAIVLLMERAGLSVGTAAAVVRLARYGIYHASDKAIAELGFEPRPFEETIARTAQHYLAN